MPGRHAQLNAPPRFLEKERVWAITRYRDVALLLKSRHVLLAEQVEGLAKLSARLGGAFPNLIALLSGTYPFQNGAAHEAARFALKDVTTSATRAWSAENVAALARGLLAPFADGRTFDAAREIASAMPVAIVADALGTTPQTIAMLSTLSRTVSEIWYHFAPPLKTLRALEEVAAREVALLRASCGEAGSAEFGGIAFLAMAGTDTTSGLLGNLIHVLAERPALQQRLREDPAAIPDVVNETLRLWPPLRRIVGRKTTAEVALGGVTLPRDAVLFIDLERAHRDAEAYPEPDAFMPGRKGPPPLVFGSGAHMCLGTVLARLEARVLVETLLRDFEAVAAGEAERGSHPDWNEFTRLPVRLERPMLVNP
jgi:cytochrome P450